MNLKGIDANHEDEEYIYVKAGAGENWHQFVMHCITYNLGGVENLSLIPGNVGASPMQNIGAYGVEIKDVFHELEAFHLLKKKIQILILMIVNLVTVKVFLKKNIKISLLF